MNQIRQSHIFAIYEVDETNKQNALKAFVYLSTDLSHAHFDPRFQLLVTCLFRLGATAALVPPAMSNDPCASANMSVRTPLQR